MKQLLSYVLFLSFCLPGYCQNKRGGPALQVQDEGVTLGTTYALIIGISDYQYLTKLKYADEDAKLFRDFLTLPSGLNVAEDNVMFLINDSAKYNTINSKAFNWIEKRHYEKNDRLIIYLSGHGDAKSEYEYYFLPADCPAGDKSLYRGNAISSDILQNIITGIIARHGIEVVLIIDACRSMRLPGGGYEQLFDAPKSEIPRKEVLMLATGKGDVAIEHMTIGGGHGIFTWYLVGGLAGGADGIGGEERDGNINMMEIEHYVITNVNRTIKDKFSDQKQLPVVRYSEDLRLRRISRTDSSFYTDWMMADSRNQLISSRVATSRSLKGGELPEAEPVEAIGLLNKIIHECKEKKVQGYSSAELYYKQLSQKFPKSSLVDKAKYFLLEEYLNYAQGKINIYLAGKDETSVIVYNNLLKKTRNDLAGERRSIQFDEIYRIVTSMPFDTANVLMKSAVKLLNRNDSFDKRLLADLRSKISFLEARAAYNSNEKLVLRNGLKEISEAISTDTLSAYLYDCKGLLLYELQNYRDANAAFLKAIELAPNWRYPYLHCGNLHYNTNSFDSALIWYQKACEKDSSNALSMAYLADTYKKVKDQKNATKYYRKAIEIDSSYKSAWNSLGVLYETLRNYDSAENCFGVALKIDPGYLFARNNLGTLYENRKKYRMAISCHQRNLTIDPKYVLAWSNLGDLFEAIGNLDSALFCYKSALAIDSNNTSTWNNLGILFENRRNVGEAEACYRKAVATDANYEYAWNNLGDVLYTKGKKDEAIKCYRRSIQINPNFSSPWANIGIYHRNGKSDDSAVFYYSRALFIDPNEISVLNNLGDVFDDRRNYDSASYYYDRMLAVDSNYSQGWVDYAISFRRRQDDRAAIMCYKKAIDLKPDFFAAWDNLGDIYYSNKNYDSAAKCYERALSIDSGHPDAWTNLGRMYLVQKKPIESTRSFNKAISVSVDSNSTYNNIGNAYYHSGNFDSAKLYFIYSVKIDPGYIYAWYNLNSIYKAVKKYDSARYCLDKVILADSNYSPAWNSLGILFDDLKKYDSATYCYRKAISIDSTDKFFWSNIGLTYKHVMNYSEAEKCYQKALRIDSNYSSALSGLASLASVQKKYKDAIQYELRALSVDSTTTYFLYNLSCYHSLDGNTKESLKYLKLAFEKKYNDFDLINRDEDLNNIRQLPEYRSLMKKYFASKYKE